MAIQRTAVFEDLLIRTNRGLLGTMPYFWMDTLSALGLQVRSSKVFGKGLEGPVIPSPEEVRLEPKRAVELAVAAQPRSNWPDLASPTGRFAFWWRLGGKLPGLAASLHSMPPHLQDVYTVDGLLCINFIKLLKLEDCSCRCAI